MEFIAFFDKFAATYKPKLKQEKKNYKTVLGGLISITVYFTSFVYLVYKIDQFASNSLIPAQSVALEYRESLSMDTEYGLLQFQVLSSFINPFNKTNQILIPFQILQGVQANSTQFKNEFSYDNNEIDFVTQIYSPHNLNLSLGTSDLPTRVFVGLQICNSSINENCADQSVIDAFFQQSGLLIRTQVTTKQYNSFEKSINSMARSIDFALDYSQMLYQRVIMEAQLVQVDDGILFPNNQEDWIYNDFQIQTQTIQNTYATNFHAIFITELSISSAVSIKQVQFVKISAVLADVGSIFQSLMMVSIIMQMLNEFWMDQEIINSVISIYYPQFKKLEFKRHFYIGPIKEIKYNNYTLDLQAFKEFYQKAKDIAKDKLTVYSSIYQISRLQFAIQSLISRENFNQVHLQGIPLPKIDEALKSSRQVLIQSQTKVNPQDIQIIQFEEIEGNFKFKDEDFNLLNKYNENLVNLSPKENGKINKESLANQLREIQI